MTLNGYCHNCNRSVRLNSNNGSMTCSLCQGEFVELVDPNSNNFDLGFNEFVFYPQDFMNIFNSMNAPPTQNNQHRQSAPREGSQRRSTSPELERPRFSDLYNLNRNVLNEQNESNGDRNPLDQNSSQESGSSYSYVHPRLRRQRDNERNNQRNNEGDNQGANEENNRNQNINNRDNQQSRHSRQNSDMEDDESQQDTNRFRFRGPRVLFPFHNPNIEESGSENDNLRDSLSSNRSRRSRGSRGSLDNDEEELQRQFNQLNSLASMFNLIIPPQGSAQRQRHRRTSENNNLNTDDAIFEDVDENAPSAQGNQNRSSRERNRPTEEELRNQGMQALMRIIMSSLNPNQEDSEENIEANEGHGFRLGDYFIGGNIDDIITELMDQEDNPIGEPPASDIALEQIKSQVMDEPDKSCHVCLEIMPVGETVSIMPECNHKFHENCLIPWLKEHNSCPVCRKSINDPEKEKQEELRRKRIREASQNNNNQQVNSNGNNQNSPNSNENQGSQSSSNNQRNRNGQRSSFRRGGSLFSNFFFPRNDNA